MSHLPRTYFLLESPESDYETAHAAVLPVPFERTTTWGKGTREGPEAILAASQALELYDEELDTEPFRRGVATLRPFLPEAFDLAEALAEIRSEARRVLEDGKFLVVLGGEHSLSLAPARAVAEVHGGSGRVGVVQFDAHADLRQSYEGTPYSHASVLRRIVQDGFPTLAVGLRSLSVQEARLIRDRRLPVIWGRELEGDPEACAKRFGALLEELPETVYLTFDVDYFDPSLVPATGTPEPGGGTWYPTLRLLRTLFESKRVVAMDVVELAPIGGQPASDFLLAKLVYKCLGYEALRGDR
jgi:agmatinase